MPTDTPNILNRDFNPVSIYECLIFHGKYCGITHLNGVI